MRRVVKVGGSLLLRDDLPQALCRWMANQGKAETLVIVGGGELIDAIRRLDRVHGGDPVETHWMCVDLLQTTYEIVCRWFDWPRVHDRHSLQRAVEAGFPSHAPTLIAVAAFYGRNETFARHGIALPLDWRTTTDSIAALLAIYAGADELVLLKSCEVPARQSLGQLARAGVVDEALPTIASRLKSARVEMLRKSSSG